MASAPRMFYVRAQNQRAGAVPGTHPGWKESRSSCSRPLRPRLVGMTGPTLRLEVAGIEPRPALRDRHPMIDDGERHPLAPGEAGLAPGVRMGVGVPHLLPLPVVASGSGRATLGAVDPLTVARVGGAARHAM